MADGGPEATTGGRAEPTVLPALTGAEWQRLNIPPRYREIDPELLKCAADLEHYCQVMVAGGADGEGLYVCGPVGTGKSRAMAWVAMRCYQLGKANPVEWINWTGPIRDDEGNWTQGKVSEPIERHIGAYFVTAGQLASEVFQRDGRPSIDRAQGCELLLIDDLGAVSENAPIASALAEIVEARYTKLMPTCLATNLYPLDLAERPGWERVADRLVETCRVLEFAGPSMRATQTDATEGR